MLKDQPVLLKAGLLFRDIDRLKARADRNLIEFISLPPGGTKEYSVGKLLLLTDWGSISGARTWESW